jgi:hypothetical protein
MNSMDFIRQQTGAEKCLFSDETTGGAKLKVLLDHLPQQ